MIRARREGKGEGFKDGIVYLHHIHEVELPLYFISVNSKDGVASLVDIGIIKLARRNYANALRIFSSSQYQNEKERLRTLGEKLEKAEHEVGLVGKTECPNQG